MSIFTKKIKEAQEHFVVYAVIFVVWVVASLVLLGVIRRTARVESPSGFAVLFSFGLAAINFGTLYYAWLNGYLFLTRNKAGQKREILEAEADETLGR